MLPTMAEIANLALTPTNSLSDTNVGIGSASPTSELNRGSSPLDRASAAQLSAPGRWQADREICALAVTRARHLRRCAATLCFDVPLFTIDTTAMLSHLQRMCKPAISLFQMDI